MMVPRSRRQAAELLTLYRPRSWSNRVSDALLMQWERSEDTDLSTWRDDFSPAEANAYLEEGLRIMNKGGRVGLRHERRFAGPSSAGPAVELEMFREVWPSSFKGRMATLQVFRTGEWEHPAYGTIRITPQDLKTVIRNFATSERPVPLDYDHGSDLGKTVEERRAAGWFRDLKLSPDGQALFATVELTDEAAGFVDRGQYLYFSPTWTPDGRDKKTGAPIGMELLRGGLTNTPYLPGMAPAVALNENAARLLEAEREAERLAVQIMTDVEGPVGELIKLMSEGQAIENVLRDRPDLKPALLTERIPEPDSFPLVFDWVELKAAQLMTDDPRMTRSSAYSRILSDPKISLRYRAETTAGLDRTTFARASKIRNERARQRGGRS